MSSNPLIFLIYDLSLSKSLFSYQTSPCNPLPSPLPYLLRLKPLNNPFTLINPPFKLFCCVTPSKIGFVIAYIDILNELNELMEGFINAFERIWGEFGGFKEKRALEERLIWLINEKALQKNDFHKVQAQIDDISITLKENIGKITIGISELKGLEKKTEVLMRKGIEFENKSSNLNENQCTKGFGLLMGGLVIGIFLILIVIIGFYS